ncbi:MAG: Ig-like domain-containing protein [Candidatus Thorarchaeota archaeon]
MMYNKFGYVAIAVCLLLLIQVNSSTSMSVNTLIPISVEIDEIESVENIKIENIPSTVAYVPVPSQELGTVAIVVENALYSSITAAVTQYRQDLNDTGYHTILYTDTISTAESLKTLFTQWYDSDNLIGAVLIGRLPYAEFYHDDSVSGFGAETFICDLFLTDLDGTWNDVNPVDGVYDFHTGSELGDRYPEIFLGRIDPTCLTWGTSVADHINTYLARIHDYRTGGVTRNREALFYIDDDWMGWATAWSNDAASAYGTRTLVYDPATETTATDWLNNRIVSDYQWGHLAAHSSATTHYFSSSGAQNTATSAQIRAAPPSFNFYNLFCCSGAEWTTTDNLGVTYTFSGSYSLATIGSSKTGSMLSNAEFYDPLGQNETIGESLRDWFSESLTTSSEAGSAYLQWFYGMNVIGDPLLSIYYDCTVQSPTIVSETHPNSGQHYSNQRPQINWTIPADVNGIAGYYYILDQNPDTVPDKDTGTYTTINGTLATEDLTEGSWYYHVVATDSIGNVGEDAAHFAVNIDITPPEITLIYPTSNGFSSSSSLSASWSFHDDLSSNGRSIVWIDISKNIVYNSSALECIITGLTEGSHVINVTTYDEAMNKVSIESTFSIDLTDPVLSITNPVEGTVFGTSITIEWDASDALSGYQLAEIFFDDSRVAILDAPYSTLEITEVPYGEHTIRVTVYDWANNTATEEIVLTFQKPLLETLLPLSAGIAIGVVIVFGSVFVFRRRN